MAKDRHLPIIAYNGCMELKFDCPYRILFGPLYHEAVLGRWLGHPHIRTFNASHQLGSSERQASPRLIADAYYDVAQARFADILASLPPGWEPDLVVWYNVAMYGIPPGIEDCPYPTLGVIHDWPLNFQAALDYAGAFDYIVADKAFLQALQQRGFERCSYWPCYAHDPLQHYLIPGLDRPYDVVFLGNMGYHYHRQRNHWLERLAGQGDRYRILISDRYHKDDYTRLLNQSKIAFNFSVRGEMNLRSYEAAACGALLLCERGNLEIGEFLVDGESCILYDESDFEQVIAHYLAHPEERQRIAANGVRAIASHDFEQQFARLLALVPTVQQAFASGARQAFVQTSPVWRGLLQARQFAQSLSPGSPERAVTLADEVVNRLERPQLTQTAPTDRQAEIWTRAQAQAVAAALNLNRCCQPYRLLQPHPLPASAPAALQQLEAAVLLLQGHPWQIWHAYNLACSLSLLRQPHQALPLWQQLLPGLASLPIDMQALSWMLLLPRGHGRELHDLAFSWDHTLQQVLTGRKPAEALRQLLLWQAFELSGYCLHWLQQPQAAIQALLQAEALGPGSFFTYAPLLQLLLQTGQQQALLACLERAVSHLGLIESFQRDLISTLLHQGHFAGLPPRLQVYHLLMTCFEGGNTAARDTLQAWIPGFLSWLPELIGAQLELLPTGKSH